MMRHLFAVAPEQGIPQLLLKSLNLAGVGCADALFETQICCAKHIGGPAGKPKV